MVIEELERMKKEMDKVFTSHFTDYFKTSDSEEYIQPLVDVEETNKSVKVSIDLPGIDKKEIEVIVNEDNIEVKANKKIEQEVKKKGFYSKERTYSGFYRSIHLPTAVEGKKAKAKHQNGVLIVTAPKKQIESEEGRKLTIK